MIVADEQSQLKNKFNNRLNPLNAYYITKLSHVKVCMYFHNLVKRMAQDDISFLSMASDAGWVQFIESESKRTSEVI